MKTKLTVLAVAGAVLSISAAAWAHHSGVALFHEERTIRIEGKLISFLFRNPHSWVHVEAPDSTGKLRRWAVTWGGAAQLSGQGVNRYTLKIGDNVVITGNPGRDASAHMMRMVTLRRTSDGFGWGTREGEVVD
jgi:hypothetical protein